MFGLLDALIPWAIGLVALVVSIGGAWLHGKSSGKSEERERESMARMQRQTEIYEAERAAPRARPARSKRLRDGTA